MVLSQIIFTFILILENVNAKDGLQIERTQPPQIIELEIALSQTQNLDQFATDVNFLPKYVTEQLFLDVGVEVLAFLDALLK